MAKHLSAEQIEKYRERSLLPGELLAVDSHLGGCEECRAQLIDGESARAGLGFLSTVDEAGFEHLSYEQMEAWVEDKMDQTERELVLAHIGMCAECARQLREYERYAPVMSAPVMAAPPMQQAAYVPAPAPSIAPAAPPRGPTFGDRLRAFFLSPGMAAAAVAIVAIVVGVQVMQRGGETGSRPAPGSGVGGPQVREPVGPEPFFQSGDREQMESTRPTLIWSSSAGDASIRLYNSRNMLVASTRQSENQWQVPVELDRGAEYNCEIVLANGETRRATFGVLSAADAGELARLRSIQAPHREIGLAAMRMRAYSAAEQEFKMVTDPADSAELLRQLSAARGR